MFLKLLGFLLFFLMLVAPFEFYGVKIFAIIILSISRLFLIFESGNTGISKPVLKWFMILLIFGLFFSLWSILFPFSNLIFLSQVIPVYVFWPLVYLLLLPYLLDINIILSLNKIIVYATLFISGYLILAFLSILNFIPISFEVFTQAKIILGRSDSVEFQLFVPSVTSLLFLIPFLITSLILRSNKLYQVNKNILILALILSIIAILLTGRRSLMLNILLCPIIVYFFLKWSNVKLKSIDKKRILLFAFFLFLGFGSLFVYLAYSKIVDFVELWDFFLSGFDFSSKSSDVGGSIRGDQFYLLLKSLSDYPFLGTGLASHSEYIIRNDDTPFAYELSYMAWLFQTGIIGFIIYMSLFVWIFLKGISLVKKNTNLLHIIIPLFVGFLSFLIGCVSNPYLLAFDHMWVIFLPIGIVNYCILNKYKGI